MWVKSTASVAAAACVEVAMGPIVRMLAGDVVLVRDSKDPMGPILEFPRPAWQVFIAEVKQGRFFCEDCKEWFPMEEWGWTVATGEKFCLDCTEQYCEAPL